MIEIRDFIYIFCVHQYIQSLPVCVALAGTDIECFRFAGGFFKNLEINAVAIFRVLLLENSFLITSYSTTTSHLSDG